MNVVAVPPVSWSCGLRGFSAPFFADLRGYALPAQTPELQLEVQRVVREGQPDFERHLAADDKVGEMLIERLRAELGAAVDHRGDCHANLCTMSQGWDPAGLDPHELYSGKESRRTCQCINNNHTALRRIDASITVEVTVRLGQKGLLRRVDFGSDERRFRAAPRSVLSGISEYTMPVTTFDKLPDDARVWVFGAAAPVDEIDAPKILAAVDAFMLQWKAHGHPLTSARDWRDEHFLAVGVDQRTEGASGCSIDGLFRSLKELETAIGSSIVAGGRVFFRGALGFVHCITRQEFEAMSRRGEVNGDTLVFDTTVTTARAYRTLFERPASATWHADLLQAGR